MGMHHNYDPWKPMCNSGTSEPLSDSRTRKVALVFGEWRSEGNGGQHIKVCVGPSLLGILRHVRSRGCRHHGVPQESKERDAPIPSCALTGPHGEWIDLR